MFQSYKVFENCSFKFWRSSSFQVYALLQSFENLCVLCVLHVPPRIHSPSPPRPLHQRHYIKRLRVLCSWAGSSQMGNPAGDREEGGKEAHSISSRGSLPEQLPVWGPKWQSQVLSWWPFSSHSLIPGSGTHSSESPTNRGYWMCSALHFSFHYLFVILEYIYGFWNSFLEMWIKKKSMFTGNLII